MIKLMNPYKPHVVKRGNAYIIRKLDPFFFWVYFPVNPALPIGHSQWYVEKYCKHPTKESAEAALSVVQSVINKGE